MKTRLFLMGAMTVNYIITWTYKFSSHPENGWTEYTLNKVFKDELPAKEFLKHKPNEKIFECTDRRTNEKGYCTVSNFQVYTD